MHQISQNVDFVVTKLEEDIKINNLIITITLCFLQLLGNHTCYQIEASVEY